MENNKEQVVYINIDDSGKLVETQKVAIYAGLVFTDKKEKDKFITQYRSIVNDLNSIMYKPILQNLVDVALNYQKSDKSFLIQASDLVAGTVRRLYLNNLYNAFEFSRKISFVNYIIYLP